MSKVNVAKGRLVTYLVQLRDTGKLILSEAEQDRLLDLIDKTEEEAQLAYAKNIEPPLPTQEG